MEVSSEKLYKIFFINPSGKTYCTAQIHVQCSNECLGQFLTVQMLTVEQILKLAAGGWQSAVKVNLKAVQ